MYFISSYVQTFHFMYVLRCHQSADPEAVSTLGLLWLMLLWTSVYSRVDMFPFLWGRCQWEELQGHSNCLTNRRTARLFHSTCTSLCSREQHVRVQISSHPHQHRSLFVFLTLAILVGVKRNTLQFCIPLLTNDIDYFFTCLLVRCTSLEKCLWRSLAHFKVGFVFYYWVLRILYTFTIQDPHQTHDLQMLPVGCLSLPWQCPLKPEFHILMSPVQLLLVTCAFSVAKKALLTRVTKIHSYVFF